MGPHEITVTQLLTSDATRAARLRLGRPLHGSIQRRRRAAAPPGGAAVGVEQGPGAGPHVAPISGAGPLWPLPKLGTPFSPWPGSTGSLCSLNQALAKAQGPADREELVSDLWGGSRWRAGRGQAWRARTWKVGYGGGVGRATSAAGGAGVPAVPSAGE